MEQDQRVPILEREVSVKVWDMVELVAWIEIHNQHDALHDRSLEMTKEILVDRMGMTLDESLEFASAVGRVIRTVTP